MKIAVGSRPDWPASVKAAREAAAKLRDAGHEIVEVALDGSAVATAKGATRACGFGGDGTQPPAPPPPPPPGHPPPRGEPRRPGLPPPGADQTVHAPPARRPPGQEPPP